MCLQSFLWTYRFAQLKGSSDDGRTKLKLQFNNDLTQQVDTRVRTHQIVTLVLGWIVDLFLLLFSSMLDCVLSNMTLEKLAKAHLGFADLLDTVLSGIESTSFVDYFLGWELEIQVEDGG